MMGDLAQGNHEEPTNTVYLLITAKRYFLDQITGLTAGWIDVLYCKRKIMKVFIAAVLLILSTSQAVAARPTDWEVVNVGANTATGILTPVGNLPSISVSLTTDQAVSRPSIGDNGVLGGVVDGSFTDYADALIFTPALRTSDAVALGGASSFTVTFSEPVEDPVFHFFQLADNQLTFSESFMVLSKTDDLSTAGLTVTGVSDADDAGGSIQFDGSHTSISWTSDAQSAVDGFFLQIIGQTHIFYDGFEDLDG